jgi:predicted membrane channel-forming protein YqfA (hemolysin III family)
MDFKNPPEELIKYPIGLGVICLCIGGATDSSFSLSLGLVGLVPLVCIVFVGVVCAFFSMLDSILPKFKGRDAVIFVLVGFFAVLFLFNIFTGGDSSVCLDQSGNNRC